MDKLLKPSDVQKIIGCGKQRSYEIFNSKSFPSIRIGSRLFVQEEKFKQWLDIYTYKSYTL